MAINPLADRIDKLKKQVEDLEDKVAEPDLSEIEEAVKDFCADCPIENGVECASCHLLKFGGKR